MKKTLITFFLMCGAVQAQTKWLGTLDGNYTYTDNGAGTVWIGFGGVTPSSILEFEWLFATNATDTSGNGYDGVIIGATRNIATNGMSANYDLANSTNSISATMGNVIQSLAWWGNTNGTWRYYEWIGGTQRVNNAAESYTTNEWFEIDGNDFAFTGSDFDVAQARGYNEVIANEVGITNRTELGGNLGIIPDYLADNTNTYWQDTELYVGFNNIIQDGSPNGFDLATASSPELGGTTDNGDAEFDGNANLVTSSDFTLTNQEFTIMAWVNPYGDTDINQYQGIVGKGYFEENKGWEVLLNRDNANSGKVVFIHAQTAITATSVLPVSNYTHVAAVKTLGNSIELYIDGVREVTNTAFPTVQSLSDLYIGKRNPSAARAATLDGKLDEIQIYGTAFSSNSVYTAYTNQLDTLGF